MTQNEQYELLLREIADMIKAKNDEISVLRWQVVNLEAKLKEAEDTNINEYE